MGVIASALIELGIDVTGAQQAEKAIGGVEKSTKKLEKDGGKSLDSFVEQGDASLQGLVKSFGGAQAAMVLGVAAIAAAVVAAAAAVVSFVNETTEGLDKIGEDAEKAGLTAEQFQKWTIIAKDAGTSIDVLTKATRKVNTSLFDVANGGGKDFAENLGKIGLAAHELEGLDQMAQFGLIADGLNTVSDEAEKAALASKLFGEEAGPQLASLLSQGSEGLKEMEDGISNVFTDEQIAKASEYQKTLEGFNQSITMVKGEIALALAPVIEDMISKTQEWIEENKGAIESVVRIVSLAIKPFIVALKLLLIPIDLLIDSSLLFYSALDEVTKALEELIGAAAEAAGEWEWVQSLQAAFAKIGDIVDAAKQKIIEFITQFEPLKRLAINLGLMEGDGEGGNLYGNAQEFVDGNEQVNAEQAQAVITQASQAANLQAQEGRVKAESDQRKNAVVAQHGVRTRPLTKVEQDQIYGALGDPTAAASAIAEINGKVQRPKGGGGKSKPVEEEAPLRQLTNLESYVQAKFGDTYDLNALDIREARIKDEDIKPEVVLTINHNNFTMSLEQTINGLANAMDIGKEAAIAARVEIQKVLNDAGQSSAVNFAR